MVLPYIQSNNIIYITFTLYSCWFFTF